ncbi:MAG: rhomboid family intramembrane serine protease [Polyangiaceae bacterium]|nr:rhomboid family intramembrane serine protease [Polyangiaceae bacterium]
MSPREVRCACGAINDVSFGTCIRCGESLDPRVPRKARPAQQRVTGAPSPRSYRIAAVLLGGLCAFVFALQTMWALQHGGGLKLMSSSGSIADNLRAGVLIPNWAWVSAQPYRLLSNMFAHFGLVHFGLNMFGFVSLAKTSEAVVGASRTVMTFVLTGLVGSLATVAWHELAGTAAGPSAGASGGILGVMGLLLGILIRRRDPAWKNLALNTLFYAVLLGFAVNSMNAGVLINNAAHIGGLLSGVVLGLFWYRTGAVDSLVSKIVAGVLYAACLASVALALTSNGKLVTKSAASEPLRPDHVASHRDAHEERQADHVVGDAAAAVGK